MSISDRLSEIRARIIRARAGRHTDRYMVLDVDAPALVAALRAVLDLCDSTPLRFRPYDGAEPFMVLGVPAIRAEIAAALGEES